MTLLRGQSVICLLDALSDPCRFSTCHKQGGPMLWLRMEHGYGYVDTASDRPVELYQTFKPRKVRTKSFKKEAFRATCAQRF